MPDNDFTYRELYFIMERVENLVGEQKSKKAQLAATSYMMKMAENPDCPVEVVSKGPIPDVESMHEDAIKSLDERIAFLMGIMNKLKAMERRLEIDVMCGRASKPGGDG